MELARDIDKLEADLKAKKAQLASIQSKCSHVWYPTQYDPIVKEGFYSPGDPLGTMGIDRQLPCQVPRKEIKQWKRKCSLCDLTETTRDLKTVSKPGEVRGTVIKVEIPNFD